MITTITGSVTLQVETPDGQPPPTAEEVLGGDAYVHTQANSTFRRGAVRSAKLDPPAKDATAKAKPRAEGTT